MMEGNGGRGIPAVSSVTLLEDPRSKHLCSLFCH